MGGVCLGTEPAEPQNSSEVPLDSEKMDHFTLNQGFSTLPLLTHKARKFIAMGAGPCTIGYLAACWFLPIPSSTPSPVVTIKMSTNIAKCPL